jgi:hypothetical protein
MKLVRIEQSQDRFPPKTIHLRVPLQNVAITLFGENPPFIPDCPEMMYRLWGIANDDNPINLEVPHFLDTSRKPIVRTQSISPLSGRMAFRRA